MNTLPVFPGRRASRSRAFTLTELLVVIAIVGILVAILIPVLSSVKAAARATEDASRLRASYSALTIFAVDHKGRMAGASAWVQPVTGAWQADNSGGAIFMTWSNWLAGKDPSPTGNSVKGLATYVTDYNTFLNPSLPPATYSPNTGSPSSIYRTFGMFNGGIVSGVYNSTTWLKNGMHILSLVPMPALLPLLADTATNNQGGTISGWNFYYFYTGGLRENAGIYLSADDRANVVFYDGHVARLGRQQLSVLGFTQAVDKNFNTVSLP